MKNPGLTDSFLWKLLCSIKILFLFRYPMTWSWNLIVLMRRFEITLTKSRTFVAPFPICLCWTSKSLLNSSPTGRSSFIFHVVLVVLEWMYTLGSTLANFSKIVENAFLRKKFLHAASIIHTIFTGVL